VRIANCCKVLRAARFCSPIANSKTHPPPHCTMSPGHPTATR
jgi:hypothetical protein